MRKYIASVDFLGLSSENIFCSYWNTAEGTVLREELLIGFSLYTIDESKIKMSMLFHYNPSYSWGLV